MGRVELGCRVWELLDRSHPLRHCVLAAPPVVVQAWPFLHELLQQPAKLRRRRAFARQVERRVAPLGAGAVERKQASRVELRPYYKVGQVKLQARLGRQLVVIRQARPPRVREPLHWLRALYAVVEVPLPVQLD